MTPSTITYAQTYDPGVYPELSRRGVTTSTAGPSQTDYGYTGEFTANDMVYLRARQYAPSMGRFLTRDTWEGNANMPITYNKWAYANADPVMYTDPNGNYPGEPCGYLPYYAATGYVDKYVNLPKTNWLNTYAAAGIAVQCWSEIVPNEGDYDAYGPAQITNKDASTAWGDINTDSDGVIRGNGLLCYIVKRTLPTYRTFMWCTVCENEEYMIENYGSGNYQLEKSHNQSEMKWAAEYMKRKIKLVLDVCERKRNCLDTDKFIAAALGQNGPAFNVDNMEEIAWLNEKDKTPNYKLDWKRFFKDDTSWFKGNTRIQLTRFNQAIQGLRVKGWTVPAIDTVYVNQLISGNYNTNE